MKRIFLLLSACVLLLVCMGCRQPVGAPRKDVGTLRISAILPHEDFAYWSLIGEAIVKAADECGVSAKVNIPQVNYNVTQMTDLIFEAVAARVDAIIVQGIDNEEYINALNDARHAGIQVVFVDTDVESFSDHLYVGTDNYNAGMRMGQELIKRTGDTGRVAVMSGAEHYPNLEQRLDGIRAALDGSGVEISCVLYNEYDSRIMLQQLSVIAAQYPEVNCLLCIEGTGAMTIGTLVSEFPENLKYAIGFDVSPESTAGVKLGYMDALIEQQIHEMGARCVAEIVKYSKEGAYTALTIYTDVNIVTLEDLEAKGNER